MSQLGKEQINGQIDQKIYLANCAIINMPRDYDSSTSGNPLSSKTNDRSSIFIQSQKSSSKKLTFNFEGSVELPKLRQNPKKNLSASKTKQLIQQLKEDNLLYVAGSNLKDKATYSHTDEQVYDRTIKQLQFNKLFPRDESTELFTNQKSRNLKCVINNKRRVRRFQKLINNIQQQKSLIKKQFQSMSDLKNNPIPGSNTLVIPSSMSIQTTDFTSSQQQSIYQSQDPKALHKLYKKHRVQNKIFNTIDNNGTQRVDPLQPKMNEQNQQKSQQVFSATPTQFGKVSYQKILAIPEKQNNWEKYLFKENHKIKKVCESFNNPKKPKLYNQRNRGQFMSFNDKISHNDQLLFMNPESMLDRDHSTKSLVLNSNSNTKSRDTLMSNTIIMDQKDAMSIIKQSLHRKQYSIKSFVFDDASLDQTKDDQKFYKNPQSKGDLTSKRGDDLPSESLKQFFTKQRSQFIIKKKMLKDDLKRKNNQLQLLLDGKTNVVKNKLHFQVLGFESFSNSTPKNVRINLPYPDVSQSSGVTNSIRYSKVMVSNQLSMKNSQDSLNFRYLRLKEPHGVQEQPIIVNSQSLKIQSTESSIIQQQK
ncbi:UNKNOWN [Stylonychia lemnae]|uniref:Uncharacterized protein n=1 Tax=Stylonychia lemnae TaxID=5949 RepID=A0A077ZN24_STYLE|nr:UNKNOWN [Stylonychia lemnae]|eukprot:CDW71313.1 UNKNOWN [Stylonychia lemnae]